MGSARLCFLLLLVFDMGLCNHLGGGRRPDGRRPISKPHVWPTWSDWDTGKEDYDVYEYEYYDYLELDIDVMTTLKTDGNVVVSSESCSENGCEGTWGQWQQWSECNLPLPGEKRPRCHNTLHFRKRYCAQSNICHESDWEFCLHEASCTGQWTTWSEYVGNCSEKCSEKQTRNRTCFNDGKEAPGLCQGSRSSVETQTIECPDYHCGLSYELKLGLIIGAGVLALLILVALITSCTVLAKKRSGPQQTALVTSSSFLLGQWRILSRRFTRRTRNEPGLQNNQEVAIGSNYSAVHVYENPNDYAQVQDSLEGNIYEETPGEYRSPIIRAEPPRPRQDTTTSEDKYAEIGPVDPYTSMGPVEDVAIGKRNGFKRAKSCDDILVGDRNINRSKALPGQAIRAPLYRGASQFPHKKTTGLSKKPSSIYSKGVVARITKKRKLASEQSFSKSNFSRRNPSPHAPDTMQEDRYGYLVPNGLMEQKSKTISGFASPSTSSGNHSQKSASLPMDFGTYVTMKGSKKF